MYLKCTWNLNSPLRSFSKMLFYDLWTHLNWGEKGKFKESQQNNYTKYAYFCKRKQNWTCVYYFIFVFRLREQWEITSPGMPKRVDCEYMFLRVQSVGGGWTGHKKIKLNEPDTLTQILFSLTQGLKFLESNGPLPLRLPCSWNNRHTDTLSFLDFTIKVMILRNYYFLSSYQLTVRYLELKSLCFISTISFLLELN